MSSLVKWPPQPSTVIGLAAFAGLLAHYLTGDPFWDAAAAAAVAIVIPDNSGAGDEVRTLIADGLGLLAKTRPAIVAALLLGAGLGLSACQNSGAPGAASASGPADWRAALGQFTVADLQAADSDAKAHADATASTCYEALAPIVQQFAATSPTANLKGAFTVFQATRDLANVGQSATLKGLNVACAPLVLDAESTAIGLAAKIGISAAPLAIP